MKRLIIVSNRLPITIDSSDGHLNYYPSSGGLATGLASLDDDIERIWIGWPGQLESDKLEGQVTADLAKQGLVPVYLTDEDIELYYEGFSNKTIWPHFHYFTQYTSYQEEHWDAYQKVNQKFYDVIKDQIRPDDMVWVQDYQLMLLPQLIRADYPNQKIGFFLHIPFPSYEIFRVLPWRKEILEGILGSDLIGFHTFGYMRHFLSAVYRICGHEANYGKFQLDDREVTVDVFPMGIDYDKFANPEQYYDPEHIGMLDERRLRSKGRKLIISIDRLDYTKGISQRLRAFERFINNHPQYKGKLTLILLVVPSRANVDQYQELKTEIDTLVGRIDGSYRTFGWSPVQYFYRSFSFEDLTKLYQVADVAMITPYRDGMNLVAKEFVASKDKDKKGVLILSEMAGAANELGDAILVNPLDINDLESALEQALSMPEEEQEERLTRMQQRVRKYNVSRWAKQFLKMMNKSGDKEVKNLKSELTSITEEVGQAYQTSSKRLIILDYDGTLMPFSKDPQKVVPDQELIDIIIKLTDDPENHVMINSGRDRHTLEAWLGHLKLDMAAEHGTWFKQSGLWRLSTDLENGWKSDVKTVLEQVVERTPGSFIEEKDYGLAWHYRQSDKELSINRTQELKATLEPIASAKQLSVLDGKKVLEIKNKSINKGEVMSKWLDDTTFDFIICLGDDKTDEDMFAALPKSAATIKVGAGVTGAKHRLINLDEVRSLLTYLSNHSRD